MVVLLNPTRAAVLFPLPEAASGQLFTPLVDGRRAGAAPAGPPLRGAVSVGPTAAAVLRRSSPTEAAAAAAADRLAAVSDPGVVPTDGDPVSRYAVGLASVRGVEEAAAMAANARARRAFLACAAGGGGGGGAGAAAAACPPRPC